MKGLNYLNLILFAKILKEFDQSATAPVKTPYDSIIHLNKLIGESVS